MYITSKEQMVEGALYAFKFYKGIRLFIYKDLGDNRFLQALQQDLLITSSQAAPTREYSLHCCSATWRFDELTESKTLRLATEEEAILWSNQYSGVTAPLVQQNNHYSIY